MAVSTHFILLVVVNLAFEVFVQISFGKEEVSPSQDHTYPRYNNLLVVYQLFMVNVKLINRQVDGRSQVCVCYACVG